MSSLLPVSFHTKQSTTSVHSKRSPESHLPLLLLHPDFVQAFIMSSLNYYNRNILLTVHFQFSPQIPFLYFVQPFSNLFLLNLSPSHIYKTWLEAVYEHHAQKLFKSIRSSPHLSHDITQPTPCMLCPSSGTHPWPVFLPPDIFTDLKHTLHFDISLL